MINKVPSLFAKRLYSICKEIELEYKIHHEDGYVIEVFLGYISHSLCNSKCGHFSPTRYSYGGGQYL